jgi:hypothetical protein
MKILIFLIIAYIPAIIISKNCETPVECYLSAIQEIDAAKKALNEKEILLNTKIANLEAEMNAKMKTYKSELDSKVESYKNDIATMTKKDLKCELQKKPFKEGDGYSTGIIVLNCSKGYELVSCSCRKTPFVYDEYLTNLKFCQYHIYKGSGSEDQCVTHNSQELSIVCCKI